MSELTYSMGRDSLHIAPRDKPVVWLQGEVKSPPFSTAGRIEAGELLRRLQQGERLAFPHSRPMPVLGRRCHELRIPDVEHTWRILYRTDADAVIIAGVFAKTTPTTPRAVIEGARRRLRLYDDIVGPQREKDKS